MQIERTSNKNLYKIGLYSAILSAVCWILFILGSTGNPGLRSIENPRLFFKAIEDSRTAFLMYGWGGVFGTLFTVPYILVFYSSLKKKTSIALLILVVSIIGVVLAVIGFAKPLTIVYLIAPLGIEVNTEILQQMRTAVLIMGEAVEVNWFIGSFLVFGLGTLLFAINAFRFSIGSKWINGIGIVGGLSGIIWLAIFFPFLESVGVYLRLINISAILIWSIGLTASLSRSY
ncbi:MAG: hypothetical protein OCD02_04625 [Spirochaetaceae bacterium]